MRRWLALALLMGLNGCSLFKKSRPAPPAVITPPTPPKTDPPKPLAAPPKVETPQDPPAEAPKEVVQTPVPQPPPRRRQAPRNQRKNTRATTAPAPAPAATQPPAVEPAPPAPQLTTIITPAEQQRLNHEIDSAIRSAEGALAGISQLRLSSQQAENLRRARSFIEQAQSMRGSDPATALTVAKRADALARDLASAAR